MGRFGAADGLLQHVNSSEDFPPMLLRPHRLPRVASSFWIDCSRLEGFSLITGKIKCWIMKAGFKLALKLRGVRDRMPLDHTCEAIYFILDRKKRQWWKCCRQVIPPLIFACQEVEPTGWYAQRNEHGVTMPFSHGDAQMCFREKSSPDQNCPMLFCDNIRENCVTVGEMGKDASWLVPKKPKGKLSLLDRIKGFLGNMHIPDVQVYHWTMPPVLLLNPHKVRALPQRRSADFL
mmetsp:Transcript_5801/g.11890  ORF Transcript_5801/g.11890 Transcript_5801/m.11890 type:complete len:234 (-) Transcript_5801:87-788(-)